MNGWTGVYRMGAIRDGNIPLLDLHGVSLAPAALKLASLCCGVMALIFAGVNYFKKTSL